MTTRAAYARFSMCGTLEIRMRGRMALQALCICHLLCRCTESENLLNITAALHVLFTRPVATFAGDSVAAVQHRQTRMRVIRKLFAYVFMAACTGFRANKVFRIYGSRFLMCTRLLLIAACSAHTHSLPGAEEQ